jgi:hypothetical protein
MKRLNKRLVAGLALLTATAAAASMVGCGPTLARISSLEALRIMGVRKSAPYARPGETVHLQMLWEDGRPELPDQVETFFGFWCLNPPANSYAACLTTEPSVEPSFDFGVTEFDVEIPEDSVIAHPDIEGSIPSGMAFVFYGVCAGKMEVPELSGDVEPEDLVPRCVDAAGEQLGADDFVIGYSQIFIYDELRNANPILTGLKQDGEELEVDCINEECEEQFVVPDLDGCQEGVLCLEACEDDGDVALCPSTPVEVIVDPASAEVDEVAKSFGTDQEESIWVSYFIDRGGVNSEVKLVNDAVQGFQSSFETNLYAPAEPGPVRVWAVVRDNRGGTAWLRAPGYVKEKD